MYALLRKLFIFTLVAGFLAVLLGGSSAMAGTMIGLDPDSSDSVQLSQLLDGTYDGIVVGDKVFDEFVYNVTSGDMPDAEDIDVLGFNDMNGNYGLTFQGTFIDLPGGGASNALLRFTATVDLLAQQAGSSILDAHLFMSGVNVGSDSIFMVSETFEGHNNSMAVVSAKFGDQKQQVTSDSTSFDPTVNELRITKGIFAFAGEGGFPFPAVMIAIDQSFKQVQVPEPATLSLLAMSLVGTLFVSRRRQG